ncbi:MAG: mechanosensitive ion channel [Chitinophagaceae bacterium]|nr:mechanosensitive ion channel [Chitinophagaceae bacterium]
MKYTLEIACFNVQSAILASNAGADRLEICDNLHEGGTTPSYGTIKFLKEQISTPLFVMVRPKGGDFLHSKDEFEVMEKDLLLFKQLGCEGVVLGFLKPDGTVDKTMTSRFVELAYPMEVTFHRAFDRAVDAEQALEDIIDCGCQRVLTSGQKPTAVEALPLLTALVKQADDRIIIIPGSGVNSSNIKNIAEQTGATELHASTKIMVPSTMKYVAEQMRENLEDTIVNIEEIIRMKQYLASL